MRSSARAMHPLHCRVSHGFVVYVLTLSPFNSCVRLDGEVRRAGHLARWHAFRTRWDALYQSGGWTAIQATISGGVDHNRVFEQWLGARLPCASLFSGWSVGLISFIASAVNHRGTMCGLLRALAPQSLCSWSYTMQSWMDIYTDLDVLLTQLVSLL
jgi:hypothetical protein